VSKLEIMQELTKLWVLKNGKLFKKIVFAKIGLLISLLLDGKTQNLIQKH